MGTADDKVYLCFTWSLKFSVRDWMRTPTPSEPGKTADAVSISWQEFGAGRLRPKPIQEFGRNRPDGPIVVMIDTDYADGVSGFDLMRAGQGGAKVKTILQSCRTSWWQRRSSTFGYYLLPLDAVITANFFDLRKAGRIWRPDRVLGRGPVHLDKPAFQYELANKQGILVATQV